MALQSVSTNAAAAYAGQQQNVRQQQRSEDTARQDQAGKAAESERVTLSNESRQLASQTNERVQRREDATRVDNDARAEEARQAAQVEDQRARAPQSVTRALDAYTRASVVWRARNGLGSSMEIGGISAPNYTLPQVSEPRATKPAASAASNAENHAISRQAREDTRDRATLASLAAARAANAAENGEPRETVRDMAESAAASGSIRFEFRDSTRVMQVYDSKDVLIYQVPPKGVLSLVKAQEDAAAPRLETSA